MESSRQKDLRYFSFFRIRVARDGAFKKFFGFLKLSVFISRSAVNQIFSGENPIVVRTIRSD
jgi:hypothetical protein